MKALINLVALVLLGISTSGAMAEERVLMVLTSHDRMGDTGKETGFWMAELTHPYFALADAGIGVDIASIAGGEAPIDPRSLEKEDADNSRFLASGETRQQIQDTPALASVDPSSYAAVIFVGGHGTMWDFPRNEAVNRVAAAIYDRGGVVAAVCHGPAALLGITLEDGSSLIEGRKVTGFTNSEERAVGLAGTVPFMLEDALESAGAQFSSAADWQSHVVVDGRLITGQNPASAGALGTRVAEAIR
ncbi:type 1 glutamine amidotransferase domain-containing protein [Microbulbifer sediminum]|uniref:type 1 glutamine amidotransferase domain-containing protein n=1 Tax=Microbulbifer sediminum TaxID=2904250 RepID=UPI001F32E1A2|nr:type 1 glutamine amidotransferase domain-containing protein [Microbulbifer sediminum]